MMVANRAHVAANRSASRREAMGLLPEDGRAKSRGPLACRAGSLTTERERESERCKNEAAACGPPRDEDRTARGVGNHPRIDC